MPRPRGSRRSGGDRAAGGIVSVVPVFDRDDADAVCRARTPCVTNRRAVTAPKGARACFRRVLSIRQPLAHRLFPTVAGLTVPSRGRLSEPPGPRGSLVVRPTPGAPGRTPRLLLRCVLISLFSRLHL